MQEITIKINKTAFFVAVALVIGIGLGYGGRFLQTKDYVKAGAEKTPTITNNKTSQQTEPTITTDTIKSLFNTDNITFGNKNSKLIFVEISDPSCPYCSIASGEYPELNKEAGTQFMLSADGGSYIAPVKEMRKLVDSKKAAFIWLYFNGHNNGKIGAKALYCANEKGKFWQAHDLIMSGAGYNIMNNASLSDDAKADQLAVLLKSIINYNDLKTCLNSGKYDNKLAQDMNLAASKLGIQGTPSFFVNTTNFSGAYSFTNMEQIVNSILKK